MLGLWDPCCTTERDDDSRYAAGPGRPRTGVPGTPRPEGAPVYERVLIPLDGTEPAEAFLPFAEKVAGLSSGRRPRARPGHGRRSVHDRA